MEQPTQRKQPQLLQQRVTATLLNKPLQSQKIMAPREMNATSPPPSSTPLHPSTPPFPSPSTPHPPPSPLPPATISVLSYNVRCDKDAPPFDWAHRKPHVVAAIQATLAHVVCLQEAREAGAKDICRALGPTWQMTGVSRRKGDEGTQILFDSRSFVFLESSTFVFHDEGARPCPPLTHCTDLSYLSQRRCAHVRIFTHAILLHRSTQLPLNVLNTHFPLEEHEQRVCAHQLAAYVRENTDARWPTVVCGDFNSHYAPTTPLSPIQILAAGVLGMDDVHEWQDFATYHEGFEGDVLYPGNRAELLEQAHRLDYILARVPEGFPLRALPGKVFHPRYVGQDGESCRPSDHEPIGAAFYVSGEVEEYGFFA